MNYTKENIFPMYVGNKTQQVKCDGKIYDITAYSNWTETCELFIPRSGKKLSHSPRWRHISDCTLLLKPISKMSEGDKREFEATKVFKPVTPAHRVGAMHWTAESFLWLIQHGYAISDELFTLGIAEEI